MATVELKKLVKKRSSIKSSINVISNYVKRFNPTTQSICLLQIRLTSLNQFISDFNIIQQSIQDLDLGEKEEEEQEERLAFEDSNFTLIATMEDFIAEANAIQAQNNSHTLNDSNREFLKLPTIQPPSFSGNLEDWLSYINTFNTLFHNNTKINDIQRLHYLKSGLSGSVADVVKNFAITADNYIVAYDELVHQYENKALTIQSHIRSLLMTPKVNVPSSAELKKLRNHVASHVRALKALGQPVQNWDAWLMTLICGQLEATTAGEWQLRQDDNGLPTYLQIESFLSKCVVAYEVSLASNPTTEKPVRLPNVSNYSKTLFTRPADGKIYKCPICSQQHRIYSCDRFNQMSIAERKNTIWKAKLYFNCLNFGHQLKDCRLSSCPKCNQRHNS